MDSTLRPLILAVIGEYVSLRKSGKQYVALCPFHSENTPSFYVNEEKGLFHCHGCHVGGDVIKFIELIEGIGFKEALKRLAWITTAFRDGIKTSRYKELRRSWPTGLMTNI